MPGSYASTTRIKSYLDINHNDDDTLITNLIAIANQEAEDKLQPWADALPLDTANTNIQALADFYVCMQYKKIMKELEAFETWQKEYLDKFMTIITKFKSDYNTRTKTVSVTREYESEPLLSEE